jgi:hypothetical protein
MIVAFSLSAMDVGGIISQDTTWDLQNSPYRLVSFLYIASGVTLTIEPGVQVQINGASIEIDWNGFFWHGTINNPIEPIAKMIVVHGKIVAHGTQANPIVFDTWQSDQLFGGEESILQKTPPNLNSNTAILTALSWGLLTTHIPIVGGHYA